MSNGQGYDWNQAPEVAPRRVAEGARIEVALIDETGEAERMAFDIVSDAMADFANGFLGVGTPLAQTLLGHRAGDVLPYRVADMVEARILSVVASTRSPDVGAAAERRAVVKQAISRSNRDDAVRHALTFNSKWGDYDPEGIEADWDDQD